MDSESSQQFCLRWHNHQSSVLGGLPALLDSGRLTDVTLCAGGRSLRAHRIVLSTCSPYFMDMFKDLPVTQQPVVVILGGGWTELCCLVAFMYAGEVTLPRSLLPSLLRLAKALHITGLTDLNGNVPDVPHQAEFDDTFNMRFESTFPNFDETMRFMRQNSDSINSTDNIFSYQKLIDSHSKIMEQPRFSNQSATEYTPENVYQELELLKQLSKHYSMMEKSTPCKEGVITDTEDNGLGTFNSSAVNHNKKHSKIKPSKYLSPVLNELEPKNRKIDKIVENLKCNQLKTQEMISSQRPSMSHNIDNQNINVNDDIPEKSPNIQKLTDISIQTSSKVADIFASNNIFMETDIESTSCETSMENIISNVKTEPEFNPEVISDVKYVPLSPGVHTTNISSTNAKLYATCYVCQKRLSNQYNLRVHLETHQNARHACVACSHVSRSRDALRKHVSYRHPQLNISHSVGRPCKASQNTQIVTSPMSIPSTSNTLNTGLFGLSSDPLNINSSSKNNTNILTSIDSQSKNKSDSKKNNSNP